MVKGIKRSNIKKEEVEAINKWVGEGLSLTEIARRLGRSRTGVKNHIRWDEVPPAKNLKIEAIREDVFMRLDHIGPRNYREYSVKDIIRNHRTPKEMAETLYNQWRMEYLDGKRRGTKF